MPQTDPSDIVHDAINDFFGQLYAFFAEIVRRFTTNIYASFAQVSTGRWTKVAICVVGYLFVRPQLEKFFKWSAEREIKKRQEREKEEAEATGFEKGTKKPKVSANSLRGGDNTGKVLGEVDNTDDEMDDDEIVGEDEETEAMKFAKASGVPEWGKNARKRQKKQARNMKETAHQFTDEQLLEMLDWSESEEEKKK